MGHFVDEEALPMQRLSSEILGPLIAVRVEMDIAGWSHDRAARLKGPPFAPD
jgi:hypothetical protein